MKHGLHIMLQRFVRSTVSTAPRPYLTVDDPWLWNGSGVMRKSRPGYNRSIRRKNPASIAIRSSQRPWVGQSFSIQIWLLRSTMRALTSPGFPSMSTRQSLSPLMILSRTSLTR